MPTDRPIKILRPSNVPADTAKTLKEAAMQLTGQSNRTNTLLVDVLVDVLARLERLETAHEQKCRQAA